MRSSETRPSGVSLNPEATSREPDPTLDPTLELQRRLSRREMLKVGSGAALMQTMMHTMVGCDSSGDPSSESAGEGAGEFMAGESTGESAGESAGDSAGDPMAGESAGESAGDPMAGESAGEPALEMPFSFDAASDPEPVALFPYGVASGDPHQRDVTLWTALDPESLLGAEREGAVTIEWALTSLDDPSFESPLQSDRGETSADVGYTFKTRVSDLEPDTYYLYRFSLARGEEVTLSHIGRTRTLPEEGVETLKLAICSCANFSSGYYHAYRHLALTEGLSAVLHLGDYIYESAGLGDSVRVLSEVFEARDLPSYRKRYAQYRLDPDLQALHRAHPIISVWDDHEFDNNASRVGSAGTTPETWETRRRDATQAYHEWLPTSLTPDEPLYRSFDLGGLVELFMLDTRVEGRDEQLIRAEIARRYEPDRQLLGAEQESWLLSGLSASSARWKVLGQQVMISPLQLRGALEVERESALILNPDQWDGYASARERLYRHVIDESIEGLVVCTGDIHTSWASELSINSTDPLYYAPEAPEGGDPEEGGLGGLGVEFVTPGVTSRAFAGITEGIVNTLFTSNPHFKWFNLTQKGFVTLDFTADELRATWHLVDSVTEPTLSPITPAQTFTVRHAPPGQMRLKST